MNSVRLTTLLWSEQFILQGESHEAIFFPFSQTSQFSATSMADDSLDKGFDIVKLTVTALMLDLVSLKLVVVEEGFEQFACVHPILQSKRAFKNDF